MRPLQPRAPQLRVGESSSEKQKLRNYSQWLTSHHMHEEMRYCNDFAATYFGHKMVMSEVTQATWQASPHLRGWAQTSQGP